jgi:hypothetical protein
MVSGVTERRVAIGTVPAPPPDRHLRSGSIAGSDRLIQGGDTGEAVSRSKSSRIVVGAFKKDDVDVVGRVRGTGVYGDRTYAAGNRPY